MRFKRSGLSSTSMAVVIILACPAKRETALMSAPCSISQVMKVRRPEWELAPWIPALS